MDRIECQELKESHIDLISKIEHLSFDFPWTKDQILYELNRDKFALNYGLFLEDVLIGYTLCHFIHGELHINNFAINPKFRKKGFGQKLLKGVIEKSNCETAYLEVNVNNQAAINLYLKFGFKSFYTRKEYYPDKADALVMIY